MLRHALLIIACSLLPARSLATPQWIEHASIPGSNAPAVGLSRFDQLFIQSDNQYRIPYPFEKLGEYLEAQVDNRGKNALRKVFIPRGRSLQRNTAAPDFFRFPREVIALEGEPVTAARRAGLVLEYRLFIAHQPKTETLEVISYNDEAARFEFQVVENYAEGKAAVVRQANRVMCLSCHQNAAPIFPQSPWTETSFNVEVANRLISELPQKFDSLIGVVTSDAGVIDVLVERANYLSVAQYIWKNGCRGSRCRAALLRAVLQFRLSGESSFDGNHRAYLDDYTAQLARNWKRQWPQGLAFAGSRIVTLDPFSQAQRTLEQDPLFARPAHANWHRPDSILARGIVYRLSGFLTLDDIRRFDQRLILLDAAEPGRSQHFQVPCRVGKSQHETLQLSCGETDSIDGLKAGFDIQLRQNRVDTVRVLQLKFAGDPNIWQPRVSALKTNSATIEIELADADTDLSQRIANGNRIRSAKITLGPDPASPFSGSSLNIEIADDFRHLDRALANLVEDNAMNRSDSLSALPFRRRQIVEQLMRQLGMQSLNWSQVDKPPETVIKHPRAALNGDLALLYPYCGRCHSDASVNPPGFLHGAGIARKLAQCAPRILTRLKAWGDGYDFPRSPMPPPASLAPSGTGMDIWPDSDHYRQLLIAIQDLIDKHDLDAKTIRWPATDYDELPPCLAAN